MENILKWKNIWKLLSAFFSLSYLFWTFVVARKRKKNVSIKESSVEYIEPTKDEVIEFCRKYYKESSKVHAESLMIYNIDDLDEYYINHEVEKGPSKVDTSSIYIKSDDFDLIEVEKEKINYSIDIGEKKEYITFSYTVYFYYNYLWYNK